MRFPEKNLELAHTNQSAEMCFSIRGTKPTPNWPAMCFLLFNKIFSKRFCSSTPKGLLSLFLIGISLPLLQSNADDQTSHTMVYFEKNRYGGWPAAHGIWAWENEILVGFTSGHYKDQGERHHIDTNKPVRHMQARSLDGGETWRVEDPNSKEQLLPEGQALHGTELPDIPLPEWQVSPSNIDFTHPDFALALKLNDNSVGPSRFYLSYNRGHDWTGPFRVPAMNGLKIAARTDYLIDTSARCLLFLTAAKSNDREGRPFVAEISDHGDQWHFLSWIDEEPDGFLIMPSSIRLGLEELFTVVRHRGSEKRNLQAYHSRDNGRTWQRAIDPVDNLGAGNPPSLVQLPNKNLCVTYGLRAAPYRICAKISRDGGHSWGPEQIIRNDGSGPDLGYPRAIVRPDGKIVIVYYFSDASTGPERYIAASIWTPN